MIALACGPFAPPRWPGTAANAAPSHPDQLPCRHPPGQSVAVVYTAKNEVAVNSVITALRWQWADNRMFIETQWAELDWTEL